MMDAERIAKLEQEIAELREKFSTLCSFFGVRDEEVLEAMRQRATLPAPPPASSHPPSGV